MSVGDDLLDSGAGPSVCRALLRLFLLSSLCGLTVQSGMVGVALASTSNSLVLHPPALSLSLLSLLLLALPSTTLFLGPPCVPRHT